jgi:hypothetical protein
MNESAPEAPGAPGDVFRDEDEDEAGIAVGVGVGVGTVEGTGYDPTAPVPLGVARTPTGIAPVDAALDRLADVDHLAADGHLEVYEDVHGVLRDALTALDNRPGPPPPAAARAGQQQAPGSSRH